MTILIKFFIALVVIWGVLMLLRASKEVFLGVTALFVEFNKMKSVNCRIKRRFKAEYGIDLTDKETEYFIKLTTQGKFSEISKFSKKIIKEHGGG